MKGFALIEVLVALLILSLGLFGIVGMQLVSLQHTQDAYYRSVATLQLSSLFERLRASESDLARARELNDWNMINANLLPQGEGDYHCIADLCTVTVRWKIKKLNKISLSSHV